MPKILPGLRLRRVLGAVLLVALSALAQFGQNKVQYGRFHWQLLRTAHFDVYYAQGGDAVARHAVDTLEGLYQQVQEATGLSLRERVPFFLYNSHPKFQQTNITQEALTEGIGGFTEVFKNRIVLPFEGSYPQFDHVLAHEMTHAVVFDNFQQRSGSAIAGAMQSRWPLWFNEGLAEYASLHGWDRESEFYLIDGVTFGYLPPPTVDIDGFMAYRMGQNFLFFLEQSFGKGTVKKFVAEALASHEIEKAFERTVHASLKDVGEIWIRDLRAAYWPELGIRNHGQEVARRLTSHGEDGSYWNTQPALSPDGKRIAWFSDRGSRQGLYVAEVDKLAKEKGEAPRQISEGGGTPSHESLSPFRSGIAWSPDGLRLAIAAQRAGHNAIDILDSKSGHVLRSLDPGLDAVANPAWSRDGKRIAFYGLKDGRSGLWLCELATDSFRRLTDGLSMDDEPSFSPSGRYLVFSSERREAGEPDHPQKEKSLFVLDLDSGSVRLLVRDSLSSQTRPVVGGESDSAATVAFLSDRSGLPQVYLTRMQGKPGDEGPVTNLLAGCFSPTLTADGRTLGFSLFEGGGWDLYLQSDPKGDTVPLPKTRFMRALQDTAFHLYRPVVRRNLSSWKDDTTVKADSLIAKDSALRARGDSARAVAHRPPPTWRGDDLFGSYPRAQEPPRDTARLKPDDDTLARFPRNLPRRDSLGRPIPEPYRSQWSLDNAAAAVGYNNLSGAAGMAYLGFSDLSGDQSLQVGLSMDGDIENTNALVRYGYLPYQVDFYLTLYHQMQYTSTMVYTSDSSDYFADRRYGIEFSAIWPFSIFHRLELNSHFGTIDRVAKVEDDDGNYSDDPTRAYMNQTFRYVQEELAWTFDNALWGPTGPLDGARMRFSAQAMPPWWNNYGYTRLRGDLRYYWRFSGLFALAMRASGGLSLDWPGAENPYVFYAGGEDFTLNYHYNANNVGMDIPSLYFAEWDIPLRGYGYLQFKGKKDMMGSLELRYPFIESLKFGFPFPEFHYIMGVLFADAGGAWTGGDWRDQMGLGLGWGLRMNLGAFILRWSEAWPMWVPGGAPENVQPTHLSSPTQYWSLGADF